MSFLGGPECSTAGNPLSQFTKHVQDDKSLQRDRLVGRGPGMQEGMRSHSMMGGQDQVSHTAPRKGISNGKLISELGTSLSDDGRFHATTRTTTKRTLTAAVRNGAHAPRAG